MRYQIFLSLFFLLKVSDLVALKMGLVINGKRTSVVKDSVRFSKTLSWAQWHRHRYTNRPLYYVFYFLIDTWEPFLLCVFLVIE